MQFTDGQLIDYLASITPIDQPEFDSWCGAMAATFVEIAESDAQWLWRVINLWPGDAMQFSTWMREIGGMFPPDGWMWQEWIESASAV